MISALPTHFLVFLGARFLGGLAIGVCSMMCPVYIGECAPAALRGRLGSLFQLGIVVGIFLTLFLNAFIQGRGGSDWNVAIGWRYMLGSEALPAALFLVLLRRSPESPRWLIQKGREREARGVLAGWTDTAGIAVLIAVLVFIASFALALGPIPWLLSSEIFPAEIRGRAMSVAAFTICASCFLVAQTFPMLNDSPSIGPALTFGLFAVVSFAGLVFTYFLVPKTKGRTLEEINAAWGR